MSNTQDPLIGSCIQVSVTKVEPFGVFAEKENVRVLIVAPDLCRNQDCASVADCAELGDEIVVRLVHRNPDNGVFRAEIPDI